MESYELFADLASGNRLGILHCLKEKPMKFSSIAQEIDVTSPEASRQLNRLTSSGLIAKDAEGNYFLTHLGELAMTLTPTLETVAKKAEFFQKHDTSHIPPHFLKRLEELSEGESIEGVFVLVNRMETLFEDIHEFGWYLSDDFPRFFIPSVKKKINEGVNFRTIYPREFAEKLTGEVEPEIRHSLEMRMIDDIDIVVNITDRFGLIALPGNDGKIDRNLTLLGYDEAFKQWCTEVFEYYWERASTY